jgi:uncharacterized RDD family membrane protein YckC
VDNVLVGILGLILCVAVTGEFIPFLGLRQMRPGQMVGLTVASFALMTVYFGLLEGLWGASVGKALCRLRLVGPDRNPPGLFKAMARALMFEVLPVLPYWLATGFNPARLIAGGGFNQYALSSTYYLVLALIFSSARRRNGFAGWHDLLTGTRVIRRLPLQSRPTLPVNPEASPTLTNEAIVGPYHILDTIESTPSNQWLLGYDTRLLRKVWIHVVAPGTPPISPTLRQMGRPGRLRWLAARRLEAENWDAFESVSGRPLVHLLDQKQPWTQVRYWLLDLARELQQAEKDGSVPSVLELDRVWITADGRAKLLDFPAPGLAVSHAGAALQSGGTQQPALAEIGPSHQSPPLLNDAGRFLSELARAALGGTGASTGRETQSLLIPLPVAAREFLEHLPERTTAGSIFETLQPLMQQIASVSRLRRFGLVAGCVAFPLFVSASMLIGQRWLERSQRDHPGVWELSQLLGAQASQHLPWLRHTGPEDNAYAIYVASHYRSIITDSNHWQSMVAVALINGAKRKFAEQSVLDHPNPSNDEVDQADASIGPIVAQFRSNNISGTAWFPVMVCAITLMIYVGLPALLAAFLFRGGLVLLAFRLAIVRRDGVRASRWRIGWRALVSWSPVFGWPFILLLLRPALGVTWSAALLAAMAIGLALCSILLPHRSLQDRLAGTCLVPR